MFMGDTGSLAVGGVIAVTAIIIHKELLIPILCGIFLVESVSVMLQLGYAKHGNKKGLKLRVFKRAPIHDHFRVLPSQLQSGFKYLIKRPHEALHENMITLRFWIITIMLAALTIITLKVR
jgi:phospho-N-acetylmuramoyl-pentapeptide-transferase